MNEAITTKGRELFEERLAFGKKYIVYPTENEAVAHALMDGHTHLIHTCSTSPRFFFTATQGSSGKTAATQLSWFFVQRPLLATEAGAGLIYKLKDDLLPTILYDEAQDVFGPTGNAAVRALLNSYVAGIPRTILEDGEPIDLDLFCPVIMNGLTTKHDIPANFLERCIETKLRKKLLTEKVEDFDFVDLRDEIGGSLRTPREQWAKQITKEDIQAIRPMVRDRLKAEGISNREAQLWRPLAEYAYCCGDAVYEMAIDTAKQYVAKTDVKLTLREQLLRDMYDLCTEQQSNFLYSGALCQNLNEMMDSPWPFYKQRGVNEDNISYLLREYSLKPEKDPAGEKRGYDMKKFIDCWQRILNLPEPAH